MKNTIYEIKNTLEGITNRLDEAEEKMSELEKRQKETPRQSSCMRKRFKKYKDRFRELQDNMKSNNIRITGTPEGEEKEQGIETLFEKVTENFLNLQKGKATQVQEVERFPIKMKPKKHTPRHIIIKMPRFIGKDKILKAAREK